jgi:hypothetical protein
MGKTKHGPTKVRHDRAMRDKAFDTIRGLPLLETQAQHFLKVLSEGTVSTNMFLVRSEYLKGILRSLKAMGSLEAGSHSPNS